MGQGPWWGQGCPWLCVPPGGGAGGSVGAPMAVLPAGPSHWKELKATCGGDKQSPVNIDRRWLQRDGSLGDIIFEGYDQAPPGKWRLLNDGHTGGCSAPARAQLCSSAAPWPPVLSHSYRLQ